MSCRPRCFGRELAGLVVRCATAAAKGTFLVVVVVVLLAQDWITKFRLTQLSSVFDYGEASDDGSISGEIMM